MPESILIKNGHKPDSACTKPTTTFTGDVYLDPIHFDNEAAIANVKFTPCARTHWHTHEKGQMINVIAGSGWICDRGGVPRRLMTGDVVWAPAGTPHWHAIIRQMVASRHCLVRQPQKLIMRINGSWRRHTRELDHVYVFLSITTNLYPRLK